MKHYSTLFLLLLGIMGVILTGCKRGLIAPPPTAGTPKTQHYLVFGDGYNPGFAKNQNRPGSHYGLYAAMQQFSYPNLLKQQLEFAGPINFRQPLAARNGSGFQVLTSVDRAACPQLLPYTETELMRPDAAFGSSLIVAGPIHNLGIPHLRTDQLDQANLGTYNLFFHRIGGDARTYREQATALPVTFFTAWLGMADLLGYAMTGATRAELAPPSPGTFIQQVGALLDTLSRHAPQSRGLIANLPDLTEFPYFSEVSHRYVNIENCESPSQPLYITVDSTAEEVRQAQPGDHILLPAARHLGTYYGGPGVFGLYPGNPIPDRWVLDQAEVGALRAQIEACNQKLDSLVQAHNAARGGSRLALVDLHSYFSAANQGQIEDGLEVSDEYLAGGIYAIDGFYLTARGQALVANAFIERINGFGPFEARVPPINVGDYPGVTYP